MRRIAVLLLSVVLSANLSAHSYTFGVEPMEPLVITSQPYKLTLSSDFATLQPRHTFWNQRSVQVGLGLVGAGVILSAADVQTRSLRTDYLPTFRYRYDDYLQFAPAVVMVGLKALGLESRSSWERMTLAGGLSTGIMLSTVYVVKYGLGRLRPDGSSYNSFPSGHKIGRAHV